MNIAEIWSLIVQSNTFNFVVFIILLTLICAKIDLPSIIQQMQDKIKTFVQDSENAKENSKRNLKLAKDKVANVEKEMQIIIDNAQKTAEKVSLKIKNQTDLQTKIIEENAQKIIENDTQKTKKELSKLTTKASLKVMENNLIKNLNENSNLHQIFIDEAIEKIESIEI